MTNEAQGEQWQGGSKREVRYWDEARALANAQKIPADYRKAAQAEALVQALESTLNNGPNQLMGTVPLSDIRAAIANYRKEVTDD